MGTHDFCDKRVKTANQFASRVIIMRERSLNQRACIRIIHVVEIASTPVTMTGMDALRLQLVFGRTDDHKNRHEENCNRRTQAPVTICEAH